jgi:hypothetical protein
MSDLARKIASKLRHFIADRRHARRCHARLTVTVGLSAFQLNSNGHRRPSILEGHTLDVSQTGMSLVVPAIRIGEHYLAGADRRLWLKLELPSGPIEMEVTPVRYESMDESEIERGYVIGARVVEISEEARESFMGYVDKLMNRKPVR